MGAGKPAPSPVSGGVCLTLTTSLSGLAGPTLASETETGPAELSFTLIFGLLVFFQVRSARISK